MITILPNTVNEKSTIAITATFPAAPKTLTWSLTDTSGTVINSRSAVSVSNPGATVQVVLSGSDLAMSSAALSQEYRDISFSGVYDSALGNNLPITGAARFKIVNLSGVS